MAYTPWQQINSSMIVRGRFDPETGDMQLQFSNGTVYDYSGVEISVFNGLLSAASAGAYYHRNIKGNYGA